VTQTIPGGLLPPLPGGGGFPKESAVGLSGPGLKPYAKLNPSIGAMTFNRAITASAAVQMKELMDYRARKAAGKPAVDPLATPQDNYIKQMKKLGYGIKSDGTPYLLPKTSKQQVSGP